MWCDALKKFFVCKTCLIGLGSLLISELAYSHGGGLNTEGCHNNRKTGDYHCHRGNPAPKPPQKAGSRPGSIERLGTPEPIIAYDRELYGYESYPTYAKSGFYTGRSCDTNIDHVVSLKDAHESGAGRWTFAEREAFSNDRLNHVPSCSRVNSSKGASTPSDFLRKSSDGRGMEYEIKPKCAYLGIYYQVKRKYRLSFQNNDSSLFASCALEID